MTDLTIMPNIGTKLCAALQEVGITCAQELRDVGSREAFMRLRALDPTACISCLQALEGAIQGVRWPHMSMQTREELKAWYDTL